MAGRKPKPTRLKVLEGNPGKRPLTENEPKPDNAIPDMPKHLDGHAAEEWDRLTAQLYNLGLLSEIDRTALAAYCQAYGRWVEAENGIKKSGLMTKTINGNIIQSPLVGIANTAMQLMHKFLTEFGMTPSSRSRLDISPKDAKKSKFDGLICGGKK